MLVEPPEMVLECDEFSHPKDPAEVVEYFEKNENEEVYVAEDGYVYFRHYNGCGQPRHKNIGEDIRAIVKSEPMQKYLKSMIDGSRLRLLPEDWSIFLMEADTVGGHGDKKYALITYDIPGFIGDEYKMSVSASQTDTPSKIKIDVSLTRPENWHFDGQDHSNYHIYLRLVEGKVFYPLSLGTADRFIASASRLLVEHS